MNKSVKAALLSGLVFPGAGQLSTGYKKRGWLIVFVICVFLYLIMTKIMQQAASIVEKMQESGVALDIESISSKTSELVGFSDNLYLNTLLVLFVLGWLISVIDAYFPGTK